MGMQESKLDDGVGMQESKIDDGVMMQVDNIIHRLQEWGQNGCKGWKLPLSIDEISLLCWHASEVLLQQPGLLQLQPPVKICGNVNCHFRDLLRLLELGGYPPISNYLFFGSYVDYDNFGLESTCLLLAYKIKYPDNLFLLRGDDEIQYIKGKYRAYKEFLRKYNYPVMECLFDCFKCLPMAALIGDEIFCVHGRPSLELQSFDQIRDIPRPIAIPKAGLLRDLLTSNPNQDNEGWLENDDGEYTFGSDKVYEFLNKHRLELICQGHQVVNAGYEFFASGQLLGNSSTIGYQSPNRKESAIMIIESYSECFIQTLNPIILGKSNKLGTNLIELTSLRSLKEVEEKPGKALELASKQKQVPAKNKLSIKDLEVMIMSLVKEKYNIIQQQRDAALKEVNKLLWKIKELESSQEDYINRLKQKLLFAIQENEDLRLEVQKLEKNKQEHCILQQKLEEAIECYEGLHQELGKQRLLFQAKLQYQLDNAAKDTERLQLQRDNAIKEVEELSLQMKNHKSLQQENEWFKQDNIILQQKLQNAVKEYEKMCTEFDKQKLLFQTGSQHQKDSAVKEAKELSLEIRKHKSIQHDNERLQQENSILQQKLEDAVAELENMCLEIEKQGAFFQARLNYHQGNPVKDNDRLLHQQENMVKDANALGLQCGRYNDVKEAEVLGQHIKNLLSLEQDIEIVKHERDKEVGETEMQSHTNKFNSLSNDNRTSLLEKQNAPKETGEIGLDEVKQPISLQKADNEILQHQRDEAVKTVEKMCVELDHLVTDSLNFVHGSSQLELQPDLETKLKSLQQENHDFQGEQESGTKEVDVLSTEINQLDTSSSLALVYKFSYIELQQATNNFSDAFIIGKGGYGIVYKGVLQGTTIAIKVLRTGHQHGLVAFHREVAVLGKVRHPNLVSLMGVCTEAYALIYEFLPNGSLEDCLAGKNKTQTLTWKVRTRIIKELRSALIFLHSMKPHPVVHGDLKPDNILIDANMTSKLGDFGICRILDKLTTNTPYCMTENPTGTPGYIDPMFQNTGEVTTKSDVYSLGIIILRLLTGREAMGIVKAVESAIKTKKIRKIIDRSAGDWSLSQANVLASLGLKCSQSDRKERPDLLGDVWKDFEKCTIN